MGEASGMLVSEEVRWGHHGDLVSGSESGQGGECGDDGFSATDITLHQAHHRG
jgi:hypothetical protein